MDEGNINEGQQKETVPSVADMVKKEETSAKGDCTNTEYSKAVVVEKHDEVKQVDSAPKEIKGREEKKEDSAEEKKDVETPNCFKGEIINAVEAPEEKEPTTKGDRGDVEINCYEGLNIIADDFHEAAEENESTTKGDVETPNCYGGENINVAELHDAVEAEIESTTKGDWDVETQNCYKGESIKTNEFQVAEAEKESTTMGDQVAEAEEESTTMGDNVSNCYKDENLNTVEVNEAAEDEDGSAEMKVGNDGELTGQEGGVTEMDVADSIKNLDLAENAVGSTTDLNAVATSDEKENVDEEKRISRKDESASGSRGRSRKRRWEQDGGIMFRPPKSTSFKMKPRKPFLKIDRNVDWKDAWRGRSMMSLGNPPCSLAASQRAYPGNHSLAIPRSHTPASTGHLPLATPRSHSHTPATPGSHTPATVRSQNPAPPSSNVQNIEVSTISRSQSLTPTQLTAALQRAVFVSGAAAKKVAPTNVGPSPPPHHPDMFLEVKDPCIACISSKSFLYENRLDVRVFLQIRGTDKIGRDANKPVYVVAERIFQNPEEAVRFKEVTEKGTYDQEKLEVELIGTSRIEDIVQKRGPGRPKKS